MKDLNNKVAVVTGGASGIGFALSQELVNEGCNVVVVDRREAEATEAAKQLNTGEATVLAKVCDVTSEADLEVLCDEVVAELGEADLVFCNAGVMPAPARFLDTPISIARWTHDVNVFGVFNTLQVFGRKMVERGQPAHLIITGSENSICVPTDMMLAYNTSKHALLGAAETLRSELPDYVQISILCPGMVVKTSLSASVTEREEKYGGPGQDPFGGELPTGAQPEAVAKHTIEQVKKDAFYIVTHHSNRYMVEERYTELLAAFDDQTPEFEGWEAYDTRKYIQEIVDSDTVWPPQ